MEQLAELLFELSNPDRLRILHELERQNMKLTQIAKKLDLTAQETSRHLARLNKTKLIQKLTDGSYDLTEFGRAVLRVLPAYVFLNKNKEYFTTHTISNLPQGFEARVGELTGSKEVDNAIVLFQIVDSLIGKARQMIWIMSDQALSSTFTLLVDAMKRGVAFRTLLPEGLGIPKLPPDMLPDFSEFREGAMENGHLEEIDVIVILSEKEGVVSFQTVDGKMDYIGFQTENEVGLKWCRDVFSYYWEQKTPLSDEEWSVHHSK